MVHFKSTKIGNKEYLVTLDKDSDTVENGVKHVVFRPMTGPFAESWPTIYYPSNLDCWWRESLDNRPVLRSSHHTENANVDHFQTLHDSLAKKTAKRSANFRFGAEFNYVPYYWEWLEDILGRCRDRLDSIHLLDAVHASLFTYRQNNHLVEALCEFWCPETNTLVTSSGEVSLSLWDIRCITGLPIKGAFYDEVVPSLRELLLPIQEGHSCLPPSCKHLFAAFHRIVSDTKKKAKVTLEDWTRFWFKGSSRYSISRTQPVMKKEFIAYGTLVSWDDTIDAALLSLEVPDAEKKETYLAAFLACWLCAFALPVRDLNHVRPGVFKAASLLASGQVLSLSIPVLASIYRGLNDISNSPTPGKHQGCFPAHYVHAWLAKYFKSHSIDSTLSTGAAMITVRGNSILSHPAKEVKKLISSGDKIDWLCTSVGHQNNDGRYVDDDECSRRTVDVFLAMRSCYLTFRYDDHYIPEPYSPHRFGRQFGFDQDAPGKLESSIRECNQERIFQFFVSSLRLETKSTFMIPHRGFNAQARVTPAYRSWWKSIFPPRSSSKNSSPVPPSENSAKQNASKSSEKRKLESIVTQAPFEAAVTSLKRRLKVKSSSAASTSKTPPPPSVTTKETRKKTYSPPSETSAPKPSSESILGIWEEDILDMDGLEDNNHCHASDFPSDMNLEDELRCSGNVAPLDAELLEAAKDPIILSTMAGLATYDALHDEEEVEEPDFDATEMIFQIDRQAAALAAESLKRKLLKATPPDFPRLEKESNKVFEYITSKKVDTSALREHVKSYMSSASELHTLQQQLKVPITVHEEELRVLEGRLSDAESLEDKSKKELNSLRENASSFISRKETLKKELADLEAKEKELIASIATTENIHSTHHTSMLELNEVHTSLEKSHATALKSKKKLASAEKAIKSARDALDNLK